MTYRQFRKMKPKYKFRLFLVVVVLFLLFIALLYGISAGISALARTLNTTTLKDVTAETVLQKETMLQIKEVLKQEDESKLLVMDSKLVCSDKGLALSLEMNLANVISDKNTELWTLTANDRKASLYKTATLREDKTPLKTRKLTFQDYYPALSRTKSLLLVQMLEKERPVGEGGQYIYTDQFDNNQKPAYGAYLTSGLSGIWVSANGSPSPVGENYNATSLCVPTLLSVRDAESAKGKRVTLSDPKEYGVVLLECGPYAG